ncbi:MAG: hypothetical protein Q8S73_00110 [Deltaproteobacteria bacterium]|nr:hypothetical protein [Deltaproteobacteria bacterium]
MRKHVTAMTCVALLSCRSRTTTPDRAESASVTDPAGPDAAMYAVPVTPTEAVYRVVHHPTGIQLASLQGPRRPSTCIQVAAPASERVNERETVSVKDY